jgi:hypothetical protein
MANAENDSGGLPFDNMFSTADGYIARQAKGNSPERLPLTWRYSADGSSHITVPFSSRSLDLQDPATFAFFEGYVHAATFFRECVERGMRSGVVVDLNFAYAILWGIIRRHERLAACAKLGFPYDMKLRVRGVWRRVPFLDTETFRDFISRFGIPVVQTAEASSPPGPWFHSLSALENEQPELWTAVKSALAFGYVCQMFGLPMDKVIAGESKILELHSLLERAMKVQQVRSAQSKG